MGKKTVILVMPAFLLYLYLSVFPPQKSSLTSSNNIANRLWKRSRWAEINKYWPHFSTVGCSELAPVRNPLTGSACLSSLFLSLWNASVHCPLSPHSSSGWRHCFSWNRPPAATCKCNQWIRFTLTSAPGHTVITYGSFLQFQIFTE